MYQIMTTNHFSLSFLVPQTPQDVYNAITQVPAWWSADFTGASRQQGDEFDVRFFGDVHYSRQSVEEALPSQKIVWLVTDSQLNFLQDKTEWTGTRMIFDIREEGLQTRLLFTHLGLLPEVECYKDCSTGWTKFLLHSLRNLITTGKGNLSVLNTEIADKAETGSIHP
jgi:hypothetical protein